MVQRQHCTGERFRLETTFNGIKEYFHEYVQQCYALRYVLCLTSFSLQTQQIEVRLVAILIEFASTLAYTPFHYS